MDGDGEWPTSEEVARHLRISVRAIHDWRQMQSGLVAYKVGRRPAARGTEQNFDRDRCHQIEGGGTANLACLEGGLTPLYVGWALCNSCAATLQNEQRGT